MLAPVLRSSLTREDELAVRSALATAWLLQDDVDQAATALGRAPDTFRDTISAARLSTLWRLHGRLASLRGDQSRAIALHGRALKQAETAHDSKAIGLAHYELGQCYRQVGDTAIVREHITKAASALLAAGDRRHLALVQSLSSISLAQLGRYDEAMTALGQAERLATAIEADDVLATVCGNQANVLMMEHRYEPALDPRRAQRLASRESRIRSRSRGGARHARADLRAPRRFDPRRNSAAPGARRQEPDPVPRDDGRGVRHARADSPDARHLRRVGRVPRTRARCLRCVRQADEPLVRLVGARPQRTSRLETRRARRSGQPGGRYRGGRRAAVRCHSGHAHRRPGVDRGRSTGARRSASRGRGRSTGSADRPGRVGGVPSDSRRALRKSRDAGRRVPRLRAKRGAARSARRTVSGGAQSPRHRPAGRQERRAPDRRAVSRHGRRSLHAARRRTRSARRRDRAHPPHPDRHRRRRHLAAGRRRCDGAAHRGCRGIAGSARTRDGGGADGSSRRRGGRPVRGNGGRRRAGDRGRGLRPGAGAVPGALARAASRDLDHVHGFARAIRARRALRAGLADRGRCRRSCAGAWG